MDRDLNYHHLRYFWIVAREGSIARACELLHVSQPTVSEQLRGLEHEVGEPLFVRAGRGLHLTATGRLVKEHCDRIFAAGRDLAEALADPMQRRTRLVIGVVDGMPKLVTQRLLAPALAGIGAPLLTVVEDRPERLLADLAIHQLDGVLTDAPLDRGVAGIATHHHLLGDSQTMIFAPRARADLCALAEGFPGSLHGAPIVLPDPSSHIRRALDEWLAARGIVPRLVAECQDGALVKAFGRSGAGVFPGTAAIAAEIAAMYDAVPIGRIATVRERFHWVSLERRLMHPAILAITAAARQELKEKR